MLVIKEQELRYGRKEIEINGFPRAQKANCVLAVEKYKDYLLGEKSIIPQDILRKAHSCIIHKAHPFQKITNLG